MAMKLVLAPTFHVSCRLRLLRFDSFRQFSSSSSYSSLVLFPISKRSQPHSRSDFPRLGLWRRSAVSISSGLEDDNDNGDAGPSQTNKTVAYDLSSGFLQNRRRSQTPPVRKFPEEDDDDEGEVDEEWESIFKTRATPGAETNNSTHGNSRVKVRDSTRNTVSSSNSDSGFESSRSQRNGIRSRRDAEALDAEIGGWMGTPEPSKTFQNSSLFKQPSNHARKPKQAPERSPLPPFPRDSSNIAKPRSRPQKTKPSAKNEYQVYSDNPAFESPLQEIESSDDLADFVPAVIKPEQPYIFSYTETPKMAPVGFREPVYSPFGPEGVGRPWTGRPPLAKSKKKPREFDSFNPPPVGKKGVKPVQRPGPFPEGESPKLGRSREEIMGAPLTDAEVKELIMRAQKENRQLNLGRDGLTHNMLNLVHEHWKRRRVLKIKCKGVPTVDMDNVCTVLEEKSGGKIIQRVGGVVYLFRGRNYNYKTRPIIPLMLWKPPAPIYPKLIEKAPAGLTYEEATEMRKLGRKLPAICHLGKNGVYINLVRDVRSAFRVDDLVKVDCQDMNPSDFKKIGAKLKDLVPCILLSFERESILMWKGPKSLIESTDGVTEDNSGEAVPSFRRELPEAGQELLEQTLTKEDSELLGFAADSNINEHKIEYDSEGEDEYADDTGSDEDDNELEAAYEDDSDQESSQEIEDADKAGYEAAMSELGATSQATSLAPSYGNADEAEEDEEHEEAGGQSGGGVSEEKADAAVREFESLWDEAVGSEEVLMLDEEEVADPDAVFEVVKSRFGGPLGAPSKPRNKRNSNELVGKKALKTQQQRLDPSVLDRVPKDPSGLLEIDELAKLLAP